MKLEEQVVSLELAKKLKELGVKQESLWYWVEISDSKNVNLKGKPPTATLVCEIDNAEGYKLSYEKVDIYSAFTVAELGEMLPEEVFSYKRYKEYACGQYLPNKWFHSDTEANARAKMLIYLKEKGLLQNGK